MKAKKLFLLPLLTMVLPACGQTSPSIITYSITYELNDGVVTKGNPDSYTNVTETFTLNKPYKQGYIFRGWSIKGESTYDLNKTITKGTTGDLTFVARYGKNNSSKNGAAVNVNPYGMKDFLAVNNGETADYLKQFSLSSSSLVTDTTGVYLWWSNVNEAETMTLTLATDEQFSKVISTISTEENSIWLYNLYPNQTYYVKVIDDTDDLIYTDWFSLDGHVRTIRLGGVDNMRDIGGWTLDDGSTIPYGRVYRSADLQVVNEEGKKTLKELGIKTEIDLRFSDHGTEAPISGMNFVNAGIYKWESCFPSLGGNKTVIENFTKALKVYTDKSNYPIDAHCAGGADRTGTLMFVIEGLLGMSYEDMAREHELTTFSIRGLRLRCATTLNQATGKYEYDLKSQEIDKSGFVPSFDIVYDHVVKTYGTDGGTFKDAIAKYVKNVLGLTDQEIESIRTNILK